ncbi:formate dehydrogenase accessory sulfurtransferase FdhD [Salinithrix halophila]|uniref:Sulfur carrier protein FdhD n=1 Tax=Salinithrix halophila TaxID=1485204 RepID=A0ABV8J8V3_9BACL
MKTSRRSRIFRQRVQQVEGETSRIRQDVLAVEEPLEIRLTSPQLSDPVPISVTMRTPGDDFELAAGFLFTEGILPSHNLIHSITYCQEPKVDGEQHYNIVNVRLQSGAPLDLKRLTRHFYTGSSCGVCGKASLEAIRVQGVQPLPGGFCVDVSIISRLGKALRREQQIFEQTGGLHAAGQFDADGNLIALREDVGRHNAVDKLFGHAFLNGQTPLHRSILMVSGRTSFEIMQKAAVAGVPIVAAVSAPSSLACDLARKFNITLIGFARSDRFNLYSCGERIRSIGANQPK